jgi:Fatty acid desaturase.
MAQKPVPNALILELEPVVQQELRRHIDTEDLWYAHDYVPFDQGENFASSAARLGPVAGHAAQDRHRRPEILLITKDNLAGYHREFVFSFILEEKFGRWIGRWTAEEHCTPSRCATIWWSPARSTRPPTRTCESST